MKSLFLVMFTCLSLTSCSRSTSQRLAPDFSIAQFDALGYEKQAMFINGLDKQSRMKFMSIFLQDRLFDIPVIGYVVFLRDGQFVFDANLEEGGTISQKYKKAFTGRWKYENDQITVEADDPRVYIFGKRGVWDNIWVEEGDADKDNAILSIHVVESQEFDGTRKENFETGLHNWGKRGSIGGSEEEVKAYIHKRWQEFN